MKSIRLSNRRKNILLVALLVGVSASLLVAVFVPARHGALSNLTSYSPPASPSSTALTSEQARETYGRIEMSFEANQGQTDPSVNFLARGAGYTLFLKPTEAVFRLGNSDQQTRTGTSKQQSNE